MQAQLIKNYRLPVMNVLHYSNNIAELIADADITVSRDDAQQMLDLIGSLEPKVQGVLANRQNSYSFSFEAQLIFREYRGVKALAILTYSRLAYIAAKLHHAKYYKMRTFMQREEALHWLSEVIAD